MTEQSHPASDRIIYCCSGASNVGVLSFQAAIRLAQDGFGSFACIVGIGSGNQLDDPARKTGWRAGPH